MRVHLINPNQLCFGVGVVTPRWMFVLAAATPQSYGDPNLIDETLERAQPSEVNAGDIVGIGIHTSNALRGYAVGRWARERGATVVFGGVHASLYPEEALERGGAHAVVKGDGDVIWRQVLADAQAGRLQAIYDGGRVEPEDFVAGRWDLLPKDRYMWGSVQTVRGCPKHCSFCSVWRTDGQRPRQRVSERVVEEIVELRRRGFRFILLADDNFYPVTLQDLELARRQKNTARLAELEGLRRERFELMELLAQLPRDTKLLTQITMEAADDLEFLQAMRRAKIRGVLVGVESVTPEGLKAVYKEFNSAGDSLVRQLRTFREHGVFVLGSFIFGLPTDKPDTFEATRKLAEEAGVSFAQFVLLTPFPGTIDFIHWEKSLAGDPTRVKGVPLSRYWLIPDAQRPKIYVAHPLMAPEEIRERTQGVWDRFYSLGAIWKRAQVAKSLRGKLGFFFISKLYRQAYANTGIATDSARVKSSRNWARWLARPCLKLFQASPMPELEVPRLSPVIDGAAPPVAGVEPPAGLVELKGGAKQRWG